MSFSHKSATWLAESQSSLRVYEDVSPTVETGDSVIINKNLIAHVLITQRRYFRLT